MPSAALFKSKTCSPSHCIRNTEQNGTMTSALKRRLRLFFIAPTDTIVGEKMIWEKIRNTVRVVNGETFNETTSVFSFHNIVTHRFSSFCDRAKLKFFTHEPPPSGYIDRFRRMRKNYASTFFGRNLRYDARGDDHNTFAAPK